MVFYVAELFNTPGDFSKMWLAGTHFKKLNKQSIVNTDIATLCNQVTNPPIRIPILTCGVLTVGIVRIHEKHVQYLLADANQTLTRLQRKMTITSKEKKSKNEFDETRKKTRKLEMEISIHQDARLETELDEDIFSRAMDEWKEQSMSVPRKSVALDESRLLLVEETAVGPLELDRNIELTLEGEYPQTERLELYLDETQEDLKEEEFSLQMGELRLSESPIQEIVPLPGEIAERRSAMSSASAERQSALPEMEVPEVSMAVPNEVGISSTEPMEQKHEEKMDVDEKSSEEKKTPAPSVRQGRKQRSKKSKISKRAWAKTGRQGEAHYREDEHLIERNEWQDFVFDRPYFPELHDQEPDTLHFDRLLHSSALVGRDNEGTEIGESYRNTMELLLEPGAGRERLAQDNRGADEKAEHVEEEEVSGIEPFRPEASRIDQGQVNEQLSRIDEEVEMAPAVDETVMEMVVDEQNLDAGATPSEEMGVEEMTRRLHLSSASSTSAKPPTGVIPTSIEPRRINFSGVEESDDTSRGGDTKYKKAGTSSATEHAARHMVSKLTVFFHDLLKNEFLEREEDKIDMDELFHKAAGSSPPEKFKRRDFVRGYLQLLILKNEGIIELTQSEAYGAIEVSKGEEFETSLSER